MPADGHRSEANFGPGATETTARPILESTVLPPSNRPSLNYYRAPKRRARNVLLEAGVLNDFAKEPEPMASLLDVAVASFGDSTLLEAIIGNDDRVKVQQELIGNNPWRQICALRIHSRTGQMYVGTGWFISPKALATAGHCVFLQDEGGWPTSIDVIPAKFGSSEPFGRLSATKFASVDGWTKERKRDFDYGVIFLEADTVGMQVGNFEVQALDDNDLKGVDAKISGYPADRDRAEFQYFHERPLSSVTPTRLNYDIDTFGGQSGSPIWQDTKEGGLIAIGIHTTGGLSSNSGTRISEDVLTSFISWLGA